MTQDYTGRMGSHQHHEFAGSPFEVGVQHGKALRQEIIQEAQASIQDLVAKFGTSENHALDRMLSRYEGVFREYVPEALDEIQGIAEGAKLSYPYAFYAATRDGMSVSSSERAVCTALACGKRVTAGGKVLMGQTKDTTAPLTRYRIVHVSCDSGRRIVLLTYPGWIANLCLTSYGLSFTVNSLYAREPERVTAPISLLERLVMQSASVSEVLDRIRGQSFENRCMFIGDSSGRIVCLEMVAGQTNIREVSGLAFGHANSILYEGFKRHEDRDLGCPSSPVRQRNILKLLGDSGSSIGIQDIQRMFADHTDFPLSICRHDSDKDPLVTTAAFIANLSDLETYIAIGNPCVAGFKKYAV